MHQIKIMCTQGLFKSLGFAFIDFYKFSGVKCELVVLFIRIGPINSDNNNVLRGDIIFSPNSLEALLHYFVHWRLVTAAVSRIHSELRERESISLFWPELLWDALQQFQVHYPTLLKENRYRMRGK